MINSSVYQPSDAPSEISDLRRVQIVNALSILPLLEISYSGIKENLGAHRDLRRNSLVDKFIPENSRLNIALVKLDAQALLKTHTHPIDSMVIVTSGEGQLQGEMCCTIKAGDLILIPSGCSHGFLGSGPLGFEALSIQFAGAGLYSNFEKGLVRFENDLHEYSFSSLVLRNKYFEGEFLNLEFFNLIRKGMFVDHKYCNKLLNCLLVWSQQFQKALFLRSGYCQNPQYEKIFRDHLGDEFNHDLQLSENIGDAIAPEDPLLRSIASWFPKQMSHVGPEQSLVIINLCAESAADLFYSEAIKWIGSLQLNSHFKQHSRLDVSHRHLGLSLLKDLPPNQYKSLFESQEQAWAMMCAIFNRMTEVITERIK